MPLLNRFAAKDARQYPILLIHAGPYRGSYANVPYGMSVLAAILENNHFPVQVKDYAAEEFDEEALLNLIKTHDCKVIGISMMTPQANWGYRLLSTLKSHFPDRLYLCGGAHPTFMPKEPLDNGFDIIFRREAEESFLQVMELVVSGKVTNQNLREIHGICFLEEGELIRTGPSRRIENLDEVPFPARHLLPFPDNYPPQIKLCAGSCAHLFSSRGCPETCAFCAQPYRDGTFYRSPENVVEEIELLKTRFQIDHFYINDDNFCHNIDRAIAICELIIKRKIEMPWVASFARVEPVTLEMFQAMRRAGCLAITFGVESGDPEVRKKIRKRGTLDDCRKAVREAQQAGLLAGATFMFGHPCETMENALRTIAFARELRADYPTFFINTPYPGSADYSYFKKHGLLLSSSWDDYYIQSKPIIRTHHLSTEDLVNLKHKAFLACYLSPRWWGRQLWNFVRIRDFSLGWRVASNIFNEAMTRRHAPKKKQPTC